MATAGRGEHFRVVLAAPGERTRLIDVLKAIRANTEFWGYYSALRRYQETPSVLIDTKEFAAAAIVHDSIREAGGIVRLEVTATSQGVGAAERRRLENQGEPY